MTSSDRSRCAQIRTAALAVGLWLAGCLSDQISAPSLEPPRATLTVSDAVLVPTGAPPGGARGGAASSGAEDLVYVSLAPGTVEGGVRTTVRNLQTGGFVRDTVIAGGFDPLPIDASPGDTVVVEVRVTVGDTPVLFTRVVPDRRRPIVVRTEPPPQKRDVPLNAPIIIVFSEPVAAVTLNSSTVQLFRGTTPVAGTVRLLAGTGATAAFVADVPLAPNTDYRVVVTSAVNDLEGDALEAEVTVAFATGQASTGTAASLTVSPDTVHMFGPTYQMTATVRDSAGNTLTDQPVTWSTSDPSGLTVSPTGLLTALAGGWYTVCATVGELIACASVIVDGGDLRVTITTSGTSPDPNGYRVDISGFGFQEAVPINGVVTYSGVRVGEHVVQLSDLAGNCAVDGAPSQTVSVIAGETVDVVFAVTCTSALTGSVRVTSTTTGVDLDGGYTILVQGPGYFQAAGVAGNDTATLAGVPVGEHSVTLVSVAPNCAVIGPNPVTVTVGAGTLTDVGFAVTCGSGAPSLRVTITTTGGDLDSNGYRVEVEGFGFQDGAPVNGSVWFYFVPPGAYSVRVSAVAANCVVGGANPQAVTITSGATADAAFAVTCSSAVAGSLRVAAVTTGADFDPNGYAVDVRGNGQTVPVNGSFTYVSVPPGVYSLELIDVASNCAVTGENPQSVTVTAGATSDVAFSVTCSAGLPSLLVTVATTGADLDPDGYLLDVGWAFGQVSVNDTVILTGMPPGAREVELRNVAPNCTVSGDNPRAVTIVRGATVEVAFAVTCAGAGAAASVTIAPESATVAEQGSAQLSATVRDSSGGVLVRPISWTSSDTSVATVDSLGLVRGIAIGSARVTATSEGVSDTAEVTVTARFGSLQLTATTTGPDQPASYLLCIDQPMGGECSRHVLPANGGLTLGVDAGGHWLELVLPANCVNAWGRFWSGEIAGGDTTRIDFTVTCTSTSASVASVTITPDSAVVAVNGTVQLSATVRDSSGAVLYRPVAWTTGDPAVATVASNGLVTGVGGGSTIVIASSDGVSGTAAISVTPTPGAVIAFDYIWCVDYGFTYACYGGLALANEDGWSRTDLPFYGSGPTWSPDGLSLAYTALDQVGTPGEIAILSLDSLARVNLTNHPANDHSPAWAPDGSRIAFVSDRNGSPNQLLPDLDLYLMNPDGSGLARLTTSRFAGAPAWSPDGRTIAFSCVLEWVDHTVANIDICAINVDGTNFVRLTTDSARDVAPAWSPDGAKIAFATARYQTSPYLEIALMNPDGSGVTRVRPGTVGSQPAWSPDGQRIAFSDVESDTLCDDSGLCWSGWMSVMNADGTGLVGVGHGSSPAWKPRVALNAALSPAPR